MKETSQGAFYYSWGFTRHRDCEKPVQEIVRFDSIVCSEMCLAALVCRECGVYVTVNDRLFSTPTKIKLNKGGELLPVGENDFDAALEELGLLGE